MCVCLSAMCAGVYIYYYFNDSSVWSLLLLRRASLCVGWLGCGRFVAVDLRRRTDERWCLDVTHTDGDTEAARPTRSEIRCRLQTADCRRSREDRERARPIATTARRLYIVCSVSAYSHALAASVWDVRCAQCAVCLLRNPQLCARSAKTKARARGEKHDRDRKCGCCERWRFFFAGVDGREPEHISVRLMFVHCYAKVNCAA